MQAPPDYTVLSRGYDHVKINNTLSPGSTLLKFVHSMMQAQEKVVVLRNLNDLRATTSRLPTEVLSIIFLYVHPPIDFRTPYKDFVAWNGDVFPNHVEEDHLRILAAVSHLWRQVVLTTPQLWTTFARRVDEDSIQNVTSLLNSHFKNVRNLPISIELDFFQYWSLDDLESKLLDQEYERLLSLLKPLEAAVFAANRASMIRHLSLICLPIDWLSFFNKKLSQCNSVALFRPVCHLADGGPEHVCLDLTELPCLEHVELIAYRDQFSIPESVISLRWRKAGLTDIQSLSKFTNLVDLQMIGVYPLMTQGSQIPTIFPRLEHFGCGNALSDFELLHQIQLPSLRSLHWYIDHIAYRPNPPRQASRLYFFSHLPHSLSSLTLVSLLYCHDIEICDLLRCVPQVSELNLINLHQQELQLVIRGIGRRPLTPYSWKSSDVSVMPNLRKLSLAAHLYDYAYEAIEDMHPVMFVEMLEALHRGGGSQSDFQLIFDDFRGNFHNPLVCRRLRALKNDGFDIEIILGSEALEFSDDAVD